MSTSTTQLRSNYFGVSDAEAFRAWCLRWGLNLMTRERFPGLVGITNTGNPQVSASDIIDELGSHLADEHVATILEIYCDPSCLEVGGRAYAVNNQGHKEEIDLFDIDQRGRDLGDSFVRCSEW